MTSLVLENREKYIAALQAKFLRLPQRMSQIISL